MTVEIHCREVVAFMQQMEAESVDLAVFDPPYKTISGGTPDDSRRPTGILEANDGKIFDLNSITPDQYLPELYRVLRPDAHVYMMTNFKGLSEGILATVQKHGFKLHNLLVWRKNNATPNRWFMKDLEYTILMRKGKAFAINDCGERASQTVNMHEDDLVTDWGGELPFQEALDHDNVKTPKPHPTAKPINLMKTYVESSSQPGELVFDPFMGAGSTGMACQELDRRFLGVELDPKYFARAADRLGVEMSDVQQAVDDLI